MTGRRRGALYLGTVGAGGAGVEPQAPEIRDAGAGPPRFVSASATVCQSAGESGLALMISPVDVSTSCLSVSRRRRQFMQTPCPYPIQEPPWLTDSSPSFSSSRTALAIALNHL